MSIFAKITIMYRKLLNSELGRLSREEYQTSGKMHITVVLDNVRSQHNIGAAFRTADAFSAEKIILCGICAVPPSPEIHKSALGAENSVAWEYHEKAPEAVRILKEHGYEIISVEQTENSTIFDIIRTNIVASPIPIPFIAEVVVPKVGHIPRSRTKIGFSLKIPFVTKLNLLISPLLFFSLGFTCT